MKKHVFDYHAPSVNQIADISAVRKAMKAAHAVLEERVPAGRYRALAITKLEEASMHANKGIVMDAPEGEAMVQHDKPSNCTCEYPRVILRNGSGHSEACPVYRPISSRADGGF